MERPSSGITITVADENISLGNLSPGTPNTNNTSVAVSVGSASNGYSLSVKRNRASSTLCLVADCNNVDFPDAIA